MDLTSYVATLQNELAVAAGAADEDARALAERLTASLDSATRLVLLEALSAAADEITRELAPGSVEVRLRGRNPSFVVTPPPTEESFDDTTDVVAQRLGGTRDRPSAFLRGQARYGRGNFADQSPTSRFSEAPSRGGRRPGRTLGQRLACSSCCRRSGVIRPQRPLTSAQPPGRRTLHGLGALDG